MKGLEIQALWHHVYSQLFLGICTDLMYFML